MAAAMLVARALAQDALPHGGDAETDASQSVEELIVRGQRMSEIKNDLRIHIDDFIDEVAAPPAGRGFARWQGSVCVGVHNLARDPAQYLVDRISALALDVGLKPGEPGCNPDVVIIFTTDGNETASYIAEEHSRLLRPSGEGGQHRGLAAIDEFARTDRAVRWWHLSMPVDARTGNPAIEQHGGDDSVGFGGAPVINVEGPSRIYSGIRDAMVRVIIVVDSMKLTGTTWQQLGDYLAVVSLAQVDLDADPSDFDSILNLFSNPRAYSGLTDWDRSYVRALYAFDQRRLAKFQQAEIVSQMLRREIDTGE